MKISRRNALMGLGGALAIAAGAPALLRGRSEFVFEDVTGLPGFRRLKAGALSGGLNPLSGLDAIQGERPPTRGTDICRDLFRTPAVDDRVPVASFSDYNCPYCRVLTPELAALEDAGLVRVKWHELPLLGEASQLAARAALAAAAQGQYLSFHNRLMRARFVPNNAYLLELAASTSLDLERFQADFNGPIVDAQIETSSSLASALGLPGTPSLVVGRTIVVGAIQIPRLKRLILHESMSEAMPCLS